MIIAWWSAGVTSAVATKLAIEGHGRDIVRRLYVAIQRVHCNNERFFGQRQEWYGKKIEVERA